MQRTTLMLPSRLKTMAVKRAEESGISFAEFVRDAIQAALAQNAVCDDSLLLDSCVHKNKSAPDDLAKNHDDYLY